MRRTKIVVTVGPSSASREILTGFLKTGVNIARFNFSHNTHDWHLNVLQLIRKLSQELGSSIAMLQDLQGPKIRVGEFASNGIFLKKNQKITITTERVMGDDNTIPVDYAYLHRDVKPNDHILLDDGLLELVVQRVVGKRIDCRVVNGGLLSSHKGVNLPGTTVGLPSVTDKDREDLRFGVEHGFDFVALSFVRTAQDVLALKEEIRRLDGRMGVIAKIEKPEAWKNFDEILKVADGVMVARGDLGVEIGHEKVPIIQKEIVHRCIGANKPVIIATQMLESMRTNPRPTRAESSDIANAIFDSADALMLSGETSIGNYPLEAVKMMDKIIRQTERSLLRMTQSFPLKGKKPSFADVISQAACQAALELKARAIVAFTQSGATARLISKYRPVTPVFAFTPEEKVVRALQLNWGLNVRLMPLVSTVDEMIRHVDALLQREKIVQKGDRVAIVAGAPVGVPGSTNMLTLHRVGENPVDQH